MYLLCQHEPVKKALNQPNLWLLQQKYPHAQIPHLDEMGNSRSSCDNRHGSTSCISSAF